MIDIKTEKLKKELDRAKIRTHTDRVYDSIQSLEWLRNVSCKHTEVDLIFNRLMCSFLLSD
jgi:hypothetical protein